jgi:hypothetical protein
MEMTFKRLSLYLLWLNLSSGFYTALGCRRDLTRKPYYGIVANFFLT